jgi:ribonuclease P protein component
MLNQRFPKRMRILRGSEFDRVFKRRASAADGLLVLHGAESELPHPRLGLAVSKRNGSAVERNRWKRVLREVFRLSQHDLPAFDFVCVPRVGAVPDFARLAVVLPRLARQVEAKLARRGGPNPNSGRDAATRNVS